MSEEVGAWWLSRPIHLAEVETEDRILVLRVDAQSCRPLEITGGGITLWRFLGAEPTLFTSIVQQVSSKFDADPETVSRDAAGFYRSLIELELCLSSNTESVVNADATGTQPVD